MYAEVFGIQSPTPDIEAAAKWIQWAQAGISAGAIENEGAIRYNLDQFWRAKAAAYPSSSQTDRANLERLDTFAQGLWGALETGKIYASSPSYWDFWRSYIGGGVPSNPDAYKAASAAAAAAEGQKAAAQRAAAASPTMANFGTAMANLATQNKANIPQDIAGSQAFWKQPGVAPLGIPLVGWVALGALAVIVIATPTRR